MSIRETIAILTSAGPRLPGTPADERATAAIADRLRALGREAELERISIRPDAFFAHALAVALAIVGSALSVKVAALGTLLLLAAAALLYLDLTGRLHSLRYLLPVRHSHNVTSPGPNPQARARVVLVAHHDSPRTGLVHEHLGARPPGRLGRIAGWLDVVFWTVAAALVLSALRLLLGDGQLLGVLQFLFALALLVELLGLIDAGLSPGSLGASNNASSVAALLELAERFENEQLENLDPWFVFPAASGAGLLGMRSWLRRHKSPLKRQTTFFVNVDTIGHGSPRFVTAEGLVGGQRHDPELIELCAAIAEDRDVHAEGEIRSVVLRAATDAVLTEAAGHPSITVCCVDEDGTSETVGTGRDTEQGLSLDSIASATDFVERVVRQMDATLVTRGRRPRPERA